MTQDVSVKKTHGYSYYTPFSEEYKFKQLFVGMVVDFLRMLQQSDCPVSIFWLQYSQSNKDTNQYCKQKRLPRYKTLLPRYKKHQYKQSHHDHLPVTVMRGKTHFVLPTTCSIHSPIQLWVAGCSHSAPQSAAYILEEQIKINVSHPQHFFLACFSYIFRVHHTSIYCIKIVDRHNYCISLKMLHVRMLINFHITLQIIRVWCSSMSNWRC